MANLSYDPHQAEPVERALMRMRWSSLTFLHWAYDVDVVQALLPSGLAVEPYDGRAWVGVIPFHMTIAPAVGPAIPWLSHFPETNVRTYARAANGMTGIWFFSLDAARLPAVIAARVAWGLPYYWSQMRVDRQAMGVDYWSRRRISRGTASLTAHVEPTDPFRIGELSAFDHFLTARYVLFAHYLGRLWYSRADHPPWPLRRASVHGLRSDLLQAAGLPAPTGDPVLHFSDGVDVRVGSPHRVG